VRSRTGCPVSTTERINYYLDDDRFLTIGDWLFPDCLLPIRDEETENHIADAKRDARETIELANQLAAIVGRGSRKPILLKMVGYPRQTDCEADTSSDEQAKFFIKLGDAQRDVGTKLSSDVSISAYSAFDNTWKRRRPFYQWESCTGLLDRDGTPRPAALELINRRLP
jgi:exo-beta-1,3-glucanase (GH17 family)